MKDKIMIRPPKLSDVDSLVELMNSLVEEKAMITVQKKVTRKQEKEWLLKTIKDNKEKQAFNLFLVINDKVVGNAGIFRGKLIKDHTASMGIIIGKEARGKGLGEKLFRAVMAEGIKRFKLKIVTLDVFNKNKIAQELYKKMGFKKLGEVKGGAQYYGKYEDEIIMVKYI
jgi:RimJ/RimL family protein N-acetyltransferase